MNMHPRAEPDWKRTYRVPSEAVTYEEALAVYNVDINGGLSYLELMAERSLVVRIASRNAGRYIRRGTESISVEEWASERIGKIEAILTPLRRQFRQPRSKASRGSIAWSR